MKFTRKSKKMIQEEDNVQPLSTLSEEERYSQLQKLATVLEKMHIGDYLNNMNRPMRVIWMSLLSGIAKGVGLTIGATLVIAIIFKLLSILISMNIPYLTDILQDVVQIVRATPGLENVEALTRTENKDGTQIHAENESVQVIMKEPKESQNGTKSN